MAPHQGRAFSLIYAGGTSISSPIAIARTDPEHCDRVPRRGGGMVGRARWAILGFAFVATAGVTAFPHAATAANDVTRIILDGDQGDSVLGPRHVDVAVSTVTTDGGAVPT